MLIVIIWTPSKQVVSFLLYYFTHWIIKDFHQYLIIIRQWPKPCCVAISLKFHYLLRYDSFHTYSYRACSFILPIAKLNSSWSQFIISQMSPEMLLNIINANAVTFNIKACIRDKCRFILTHVTVYRFM